MPEPQAAPIGPDAMQWIFLAEGIYLELDVGRKGCEYFVRSTEEDTCLMGEFPYFAFPGEFAEVLESLGTTVR